MLQKKIIVHLFCFIFCFCAISNAGYLEKYIADQKYKDLRLCIKEAGNDASQCIDTYRDYLKAEIKSIKSGSSDNDKKRLEKMVSYLEETTKYYINFARKSDKNNVKYYRKLILTASLLTKLSEKYNKYHEYIKEANQKLKASKATIGLSELFKKITQRTVYPSIDHSQKVNSLLLIIEQYEIIDKDLEDKIFKYIDFLINDYLRQLLEIKTALEEVKVPNISGIDYKNENFQKFSKIKNKIKNYKKYSVDVRKTVLEIRDLSNQLLSKLISETEILNSKYLEGSLKINGFPENSFKKQLNSISPILRLSRSSGIIADIKKTSENFHDNSIFIISILDSKNSAKNNNFLAAYRNLDKASSVANFNSKLKKRVNSELSGLRYKINKDTFRTAKKLYSMDRPLSSLKEINRIKEIGLTQDLKEIKKKIQESIVAAIEVTTAYYANPISADENYKNKTFFIMGIVGNISYTLTGIPKIEYIVGGDMDPIKMHLVFKKNERDKISKLLPGSSIMVKGRCIGKRLNIIRFDNCKLINN